MRTETQHKENGNVTASLAAQIFRMLAAMVAVFQAALVIGAPWGRLTWGGRYPGVLPWSMRGAAALSLLLMVAFAWIIGVRAGSRGSRWQRRTRGVAWIVVSYCGLGVFANALTPSPWERVLWLPVVALMLFTSVRVARSPLLDREVPHGTA